jgi:hypothetical protein
MDLRLLTLFRFFVFGTGSSGGTKSIPLFVSFSHRKPEWRIQGEVAHTTESLTPMSSNLCIASSYSSCWKALSPAVNHPASVVDAPSVISTISNAQDLVCLWVCIMSSATIKAETAAISH